MQWERDQSTDGSTRYSEPVAETVKPVSDVYTKYSSARRKLTQHHLHVEGSMRQIIGYYSTSLNYRQARCVIAHA